MAASNRSSSRHDGPALKSPFVNAGTAHQWESFPRSLCPWMFIFFTKSRGGGKGHTGEITGDISLTVLARNAMRNNVFCSMQV